MKNYKFITTDKVYRLSPPISRMGGKSQLRNTIIPMIPEHTCYAEVFFGAGWVYFGKQPSQTEVINDVDGELTNLFRMLKLHQPEMERLLTYELSSRDIFNTYKQSNVKNLTEIQRAVRTLYLFNYSFASKGEVYGYGTTRMPSQKVFHGYEPIRERLKNTYIENLHFADILKRYDRSHTFFFCDPPYYKTESYTDIATGKDVAFGDEQHLQLRDMLSKIEGKFLLTINDHPQIREWYKDFNIQEVQVKYTISRKKENRKSGELIITNYKI